MAQAGAAAAASSAQGSLSRGAHPLLAHMPDRGEALRTQRANLLRFIEDNAAEFEAMPYEPWTVDPPRSKRKDLPVFDVRASKIPGLRGVFPHEVVPPTKLERVLMYYSGLLFTSPLFEKFCTEYYCPTGLSLPALDYTSNDGAHQWTVQMLIIGDPTLPGALINDGCFGKSDGQKQAVAAAGPSDSNCCSLCCDFLCPSDRLGSELQAAFGAHIHG